MDRNRLVFILGMHRSGSSALAGSLYHCGLPLGNNLLMGLSDNPKGHFEHRAVLAVNEHILGCLVQSWSSVVPMPMGWETSWDWNDVKRTTLLVLANAFE